MSKPKPQTAAEFMAELAKNPVYTRIRAEKDEKHRRLSEHFNALSRPILVRLELAGFRAATIQEIVKQYAPLPRSAVSILLECLADCSVEQIQESCIRALSAARESFDGRPLIACYKQTQSEGLKFAILNTVALVNPHSIDEWLEQAQANDFLQDQLTKLGINWR